MASFIISYKPQQQPVIRRSPTLEQFRDGRLSHIIILTQQGFADPPPPPSPADPITPPVFPGILVALLELDLARAARKPRMNPTQILGTRDPILDNNGNPLSGGTIDVFAPGTTTRVTSYMDSALTQANTNPVRLSGSGRGSIWVGQPVDIRVNSQDGGLIANEFNLAPQNIVSGFNSGLVPNGSFELDTDMDDVPDGWLAENAGAGSNNGLESGAGNTAAGDSSYRFQSGGNGGGELVTENPFPVNDFDQLRVEFVLRSTVPTVRNVMRIEWSDVSDVAILSTDVYDSVANPAVFTKFNFQATPPAGARLARIRFLGGTTGGTLAGSTYLDNVNVFYPVIQIGVFDNITVQNNEIIATNTNGEISITPNGTGALNLGGGSLNISAPGVSMAGTLSVVSDATIGGMLGVVGAIEGASLATVAGGDVTVGGNLNALVDAIVSGDLTVSGANVDLGTAAVAIGGDVSAPSSDLTVQSITASAQSTIEALSVPQNQTIGGTLAVTGDATAGTLSAAALTVNASNVAQSVIIQNTNVPADSVTLEMSTNRPFEDRFRITNQPAGITLTGSAGPAADTALRVGDPSTSRFGQVNLTGGNFNVENGRITSALTTPSAQPSGLNLGSRTYAGAATIALAVRFSLTVVVGASAIGANAIASFSGLSGLPVGAGSFPTTGEVADVGGSTNQVGVIVHEEGYSGSSTEALLARIRYDHTNQDFDVHIANLSGSAIGSFNLTIQGSLIYYRE